MAASTTEHRNISARDGYSSLSRASSLARRPGIVILEQDLDALVSVAGSRSAAHTLVSALQRQGRLRRVRRGAYVLADSSGSMRPGLLDLIAALTPKPYLITAGAALQFHELTDQHFRRVHVLAPSQLRSWSWRGDTVRYARTSRTLRGEATRTRKTAALIATPPRAIADSLAHPGWGVTLAQVAEALDLLLRRDTAAADRLAVEAAMYGSHALARRLGLLVSHLAGEDSARPFLALRGASKAPTLLAPGAPDEGPVERAWNVRENVPLARLTHGGA